MSDPILPTSFPLGPTKPAAPVLPPRSDKVSETAHRAVPKGSTRRTASLSNAEALSSATTAKKPGEKVSLLVTPTTVVHAVSGAQLMDIIVKNRGIRYRVTYRLKAGETTPSDFEDYANAIIEAGHIEAEKEEDPLQKKGKQELLKKPFIVRDSGADSYTLSPVKTNQAKQTQIQVKIPPQFSQHKNKIDPFTLPEYRSHSEQLMSELWQQKKGPLPSPQNRPPITKSPPIQKKAETPPEKATPPHDPYALDRKLEQELQKKVFVANVATQSGIEEIRKHKKEIGDDYRQEGKEELAYRSDCIYDLILKDPECPTMGNNFNWELEKQAFYLKQLKWKFFCRGHWQKARSRFVKKNTTAPAAAENHETPPLEPAAERRKTGRETVEEFRANYLEKANGDPAKIKKINRAFEELYRNEEIGEAPLEFRWVAEKITEYAKTTQQFGFPLRKFFRKSKKT